MKEKKRITISISSDTFDKMEKTIPIHIRNDLIDALLSFASDKLTKTDPYTMIGALNSGRFQIVEKVETGDETNRP